MFVLPVSDRIVHSPKDAAVLSSDPKGRKAGRCLRENAPESGVFCSAAVPEFSVSAVAKSILSKCL